MISRKAKAIESVKLAANAKPKQSVKALLTAKKSDSKKPVAVVASNSKSATKGKPMAMPNNHIVAMAQKITANNKALTDKNKIISKGQKVATKAPATKAPITVAVVNKNNTLHKKSKISS